MIRRVLVNFGFLSIMLTIASSEIIDKYIELNKSITLPCNLPEDDKESVMWEYASNRAEASRGSYQIFSNDGVLAFSKPKISYLEGHLSQSSWQTLTITPQSLVANGVYRCKEWSQDTQSGNSYQVIVISKPTIMFDEDNQQYLLKHQPSSLTCTARNSEPEPTITWYYNNQLVNSSSISSETKTDVRSQTKTVKSTAVIQAIVTNDDLLNGVIKCTASTTLPEEINFGEVSTEITLPYQYPPSTPTISGKPIQASSSDKQHLTCSGITGNPTPTISWKFDESLQDYAVSEDGTLVLTNVPLTANDTSISCLVGNIHDVQETTINLIVVKQLKNASSNPNIILMVGVVVAIVILSLIGGVVGYQRCMQRADYSTNEDAKNTAPDGISYEQNPETEALAPGEKNIPKELLM